MDVSGCLVIPLPSAGPKGLSKEHALEARHITILYLQKQPEEQIALAGALAASLAMSWHEPLEGAFGGWVHVFDAPEHDVHVYMVIDHNITPFREALIAELSAAGVNVEQTYPEYHPHVTIAYVPKDTPEPVPEDLQSFVSDRVEYWVEDRILHMQMGPETSWAAKAVAGEQQAGHRYVDRKPKPGGGWIYIYAKDRRDERDKEETTAAGKRKREAEQEVQGSREQQGRKQQEAEETFTKETIIERVQNIAKGVLEAHIMESGKDTYDEDGQEVGKTAHRPDELIGIKKFTSRKIAEMFAKTIPGANVQMTIYPNSPVAYFYLAQQGKPANPDSSPVNPFFGLANEDQRTEEEGVQV